MSRPDIADPSARRTGLSGRPTSGHAHRWLLALWLGPEGADYRRRALREFWGWLSGAGYRPERHYMRGGAARSSGTSY